MFSLRKSLCSLVSAIALMLLVAGAQTNTLVVTSTADDGNPGTLRAAIAAATSGDTITFDVTGTITLGSQLSLDKNLTINGPGAAQLSISGNNATRVFNVPVGVTATFQGLTISNGRDATAGGGVANQGTVTVTDCIVTGNYARYNGGGLHNQGGTMTVDRCTISGNSTGLQGGGITKYYGTLVIRNSTLSGNSSIYGGGIYSAFDTVTMTNCTMWSNAASYGGAMWLDHGTLTLSSSTVAGNYGWSFVGGIRSYFATMNFKNCIFDNNYGWSMTNGGVPIYTAGVNIDTDGTGPGFIHTNAAQLNLGDLADNGGPTQTCALLPGSIAIDAATEGTDWSGNPINSDQRGIARPQGSAFDVGAYEVFPNDPPVANAGSDQTVEATGTLTAVTLDGSGSSDPNGDQLTYEWKEGSTVLGDTANLSVSLPLGDHTIILTVTDSHGASSSDNVLVTIQDTLLPTLTWGAQTPAPNAAGWNNTPVDLSFTVADSGSGVVSVSTSNPLHFASEGAGQTQDVIVTDNAGNSSTFTSPAVKIDRTAPVTTGFCTGTAATVTLSASDNLSGVKASYYKVDEGPQLPYTGPFTLTQSLHWVQFWSVDRADNYEEVKYIEVNTLYAVTVAVDNASGRRGGRVTLSATVTQTSNRAKLAGKAVTFMVDGVGFVGNATTNKQGIASLSFTIPTTFGTGSSIIRAISQPDGNYASGSGTGTLTVR